MPEGLGVSDGLGVGATVVGAGVGVNDGFRPNVGALDGSGDGGSVME